MPRVRYVPTDRVLRIGKWALFSIAAIVLVLATAAVVWLALDRERFVERDEQSAADRASLRSDLEAEQMAREALAEQLRQLGEHPVVEPESKPEPGHLIAIPGPRGASCVEELGYPRCRGDKGEPSKVPGPEGVAGANGADGATGPAGKDGADGKDGAQGPQGEQGPSGPAGPAGTAQPGTYSCGDNQAIKSFTVAEGGAVTYTCVDLPQLPGGGNKP